MNLIALGIRVQFPMGARDFSLLQSAQAVWGPPSGYTGLSLGIKWLWPEANHLSSSNAEVKNKWNCTSAPSYALVVCTGTALPVPDLIGSDTVSYTLKREFFHITHLSVQHQIKM
jgi:hypothetical protein